jgi:signal transduction histidine kinase
MMVRLKMLDKADLSNLSKEIDSLKKSLIEEMGAIHNLALELRPSVLDDMGLVAALELYLNQFRERHGLHVDLVKIGMEDKRADHCVETCIYRIIQESLTNVVKHAKADTIKILLELRQENIRGIIEDNGSGFDLCKIPRERLGIYGMEERASLLGGTLKVDSEPGQGTMVSFTIPAKGIMECYE